jgi:hypothetical protein
MNKIWPLPLQTLYGFNTKIAFNRVIKKVNVNASN